DDLTNLVVRLVDLVARTVTVVRPRAADTHRHHRCQEQGKRRSTVHVVLLATCRCTVGATVGFRGSRLRWTKSSPLAHREGERWISDHPDRLPHGPTRSPRWSAGSPASCRRSRRSGSSLPGSPCP